MVLTRCLATLEQGSGLRAQGSGLRGQGSAADSTPGWYCRGHLTTTAAVCLSSI